MSIKQKTDLFRFVTLRAPQLADENSKTIGFIYHPKPTDSHFLNGIVNEPDINTARQIVIERAVNFSDIITSLNYVKQEYQTFWNFSNLLLKNKNNISDILTNIPSSPLDLPIQIKLWDNIFHSLITRQNKQIRQACLQLIVASNFVDSHIISDDDVTTKIQYPKKTEEFTISEKKEQYLKRLANAKVLIPSAFSAGKDEEQAKKLIDTETFNASLPKLHSSKQQQIRHEIELSKIYIEKLTKIKNELLDLNKNYTNEYQKAYDKEYALYVKNTEISVNEWLEKNPEVQQSVKQPSVNETTSTEQLIPDDITEDFSFQFPKIFSNDYLNGLSKETTDFIDAHNFQKTPIKRVIAHVNKLITQNRKTASQLTKSTRTKTMIKGVMIEENVGLYDFSFSFHHGQDLIEPNKIFFLLTLDYPNAYFESAIFSLKIDGKEYINDDVDLLNSTLGNICSNSSKYNFDKQNNSQLNIFTHIFNSKSLLDTELSPTTVFELYGNLRLSNGVELKLRKKGNMCKTIITDAATVVNKPVELSTIHYGLNNIGVADFRRVEQELCCYIPGEVSHIENIMAKEYKEKSSRNLLRSENTIDYNQETENEEISDLSSTTRFETNTEVAKIIQEDRSRNFGFGVNLSYENPLFSVGASSHGDFAFAKSSSDSNTLAKLYAEEVTRRAIERITQKTSIQRTYKVTREFEENIQHGFDNTNGEQHVTGVYRWIDKKYTNRLINYGKKLMYEFMIPEPAKFYKRAVVVEAQEAEPANTNNNTGNNAPAPVAPDALTINTATEINRTNYQQFASKYGASVEVPPEAEVVISGSYSQNIGNTDKPQSFSYNDLIIPPDYECSEIDHNGTCNYKARVGARASITITVAGFQHSISGLRGVGAVTIDKDRQTSAITGNLPVAVDTKKITSFNFSTAVTCQLKDSIYRQWQQSTFNAIQSAYQSKLDAYNAEMQIFEQENDFEEQITQTNEDTTIKQNPRFNTNIVLTEIKRICIEILTKPFAHLPQGGNFYADKEAETSNIPELSNLENLQKYGSNVKFLEQAFDWELMAQKFYPYYWADKAEWKNLFQSNDSVDTVFRQFLQSGMARIIVPVREGFETAVAYFMETGDIWNGTGMVIDTSDDLYLSIVDEMNVTEGVVEDEWETIVPTSLNIIQKNSVLLDENGLPCCTETADLKLITSSSTLTPKTEV